MKSKLENTSFKFYLELFDILLVFRYDYVLNTLKHKHKHTMRNSYSIRSVCNVYFSRHVEYDCQKISVYTCKDLYVLKMCLYPWTPDQARAGCSHSFI